MKIIENGMTEFFEITEMVLSGKGRRFCPEHPRKNSVIWQDAVIPFPPNPLL
jgi:hypothetical protein